MRVYSIGHSTRPVEVLLSMLADAGIVLLADVRAIPRSRRNPQFDAADLAASLQQAGIAYHHMPALGGRRGAQQLGRPSPNGLWREPAFRNYADYALTAPFQAGLSALITLAAGGSLAVMCAEAAWTQCHRRIITDHLLAAGHEVVHLLAPDEQESARLTPGAEPQAEGLVSYPPLQGDLF
jgi:uncharacterized protein (DUF488 family)